MSRSYRKTARAGNTKAESEATFKREYNKRMRGQVRDLLNKVTCGGVDLDELDDLVMPETEEVCDIWLGPKDGKTYYGMFEGEEWYKKHMRK